MSCSPPSGSGFPVGQTTVTCSATDHSNNTGQASFTVTVHDVTAPQLTVPADQTVGATSPAGAVVSYSAQATDNVDGAIMPVCAPRREARSRRRPRRWSRARATDAAHNETTQDVPRHRQRLRAGADACQRHRRRGEQPERRGRHVHAAVRHRHRRRWPRGHLRTALGHHVPARRDDSQLPRDELVEPDVDVQLRRARARHDAARAAGSRSVLVTSDSPVSGDRPIRWQVPRPPRDGSCRPISAVRSNAPPVFQFGKTTVTFTATDASGNRSTASGTVEVIKSHAPTPTPVVTPGTTPPDRTPPGQRPQASRSACRGVLRCCSGALRPATSIMSRSSARPEWEEGLDGLQRNSVEVHRPPSDARSRLPVPRGRGRQDGQPVNRRRRACARRRRSRSTGRSPTSASPLRSYCTGRRRATQRSTTSSSSAGRRRCCPRGRRLRSSSSTRSGRTAASRSTSCRAGIRGSCGPRAAPASPPKYQSLEGFNQLRGGGRVTRRLRIRLLAGAALAAALSAGQVCAFALAGGSASPADTTTATTVTTVVAPTTTAPPVTPDAPPHVQEDQAQAEDRSPTTTTQTRTAPAKDAEHAVDSHDDQHDATSVASHHEAAGCDGQHDSGRRRDPESRPRR